MPLPPGPWKRGTRIDTCDEGYMTRSRCQTGWRVHKDRQTGEWEAYNNLRGPEYHQFASAGRAWAFVMATIYGKHALADAVIQWCMPKWVRTAEYVPTHTPAEGRWDAHWILYPQRYIIGWDGSDPREGLVFAEKREDGRLWLTGKGWAEVYNEPRLATLNEPVDALIYDDVRRCSLCNRPRDNTHTDLCPLCLLELNINA